MSDIKKKPISSLGYNFVAKEFIPKEKMNTISEISRIEAGFLIVN
jgi:hypothetical protein